MASRTFGEDGHDEVASFGEKHFGSASWVRTTTQRLACIADLIYRHPGGTLPAKLHDPKDYKAMDRLMNRPEVTHTAVLEPHRQRTLERMRQATGVVLVLHDTTELDYSGLRSISDLGPIGGGLNRGFLCHNSLAFDPQRHEVIGVANQILHRRRHVGRKEKVRAKRERLDRESRLWITGWTRWAPSPKAACGCMLPIAAPTRSSSSVGLQPRRQEFVMRSKVNRVIRHGHDPHGPKDYLHTYARSLPLRGQRTVVVSARPGQPKRKAGRGGLRPRTASPPHVRRGLYEKRPLPLWVVRVAEVNPPAGVKPLEWILLTNRPVQTRGCLGTGHLVRMQVGHRGISQGPKDGLRDRGHAVHHLRGPRRP